MSILTINPKQGELAREYVQKSLGNVDSLVQARLNHIKEQLGDDIIKIAEHWIGIKEIPSVEQIIKGEVSDGAQEMVNVRRVNEIKIRKILNSLGEQLKRAVEDLRETIRFKGEDMKPEERRALERDHNTKMHFIERVLKEREANSEEWRKFQERVKDLSGRPSDVLIVTDKNEIWNNIEHGTDIFYVEMNLRTYLIEEILIGFYFSMICDGGRKDFVELNIPRFPNNGILNTDLIDSLKAVNRITIDVKVFHKIFDYLRKNIDKLDEKYRELLKPFENVDYGDDFYWLAAEFQDDYNETVYRRATKRGVSPNQFRT